MFFKSLQAEEKDGWRVDTFGIDMLARDFFWRNDGSGHHMLAITWGVSSPSGLAS